VLFLLPASSPGLLRFPVRVLGRRGFPVTDYSYYKTRPFCLGFPRLFPSHRSSRAVYVSCLSTGAFSGVFFPSPPFRFLSPTKTVLSVQISCHSLELLLSSFKFFFTTFIEAFLQNANFFFFVVPLRFASFVPATKNTLPPLCIFLPRFFFNFESLFFPPQTYQFAGSTKSCFFRTDPRSYPPPCSRLIHNLTQCDPDFGFFPVFL